MQVKHTESGQVYNVYASIETSGSKSLFYLLKGEGASSISELESFGWQLKYIHPSIEPLRDKVIEYDYDWRRAAYFDVITDVYQTNEQAKVLLLQKEDNIL